MERVLEEILEACFWSGLGGARCGVERRNDGNHFWLGVLGVLELGIRKNKLGTEDNGWSGRIGVGRGELEI